MFRYKTVTLKWLRMAGFLSLGFLVLTISSHVNLSALLGHGAAFAKSHYGILDQQAPELGLDDWIDGNGNVSEPFKLADHRGKVIYLYFFQDW